jgi:hypothetical protein
LSNLCQFEISRTAVGRANRLAEIARNRSRPMCQKKDDKGTQLNRQ